jgi:hypothetical protein
LSDAVSSVAFNPHFYLHSFGTYMAKALSIKRPCFLCSLGR